MYQALEQFKMMDYNIYSEMLMPSYLISMLVLMMYLFFMNLMLIKPWNLMVSTKSLVQTLFEELYIFILNVLKQNMGESGILYFPSVFNIFYMMYFMNMGGLIGYNFQLTSHMFVTFCLSFTLFIGVIMMGIYNLKKKFWNQFLPKDAPKVLFPLLVMIETISYIMSPFTLGMRLFANIFSGHVLLFVMMSFVMVLMEKKLMMAKILMLMFPMMLLFFMMSLELLMMFLQAYVFIMLFCVYLNDSLHAH